ncbi:MAG: hypothetical protein RI963_2680 [Planctomycetota bacterium]
MKAADQRAFEIDDLLRLKRVADPQLSPDGKMVVYQVTEVLDPPAYEKQTHLWIAATDGKSPPRQLTASGKSDSHPRWSPDGKTILFESTRSGESQLYLIDLVEGGEARKLTDISTGASGAIWSPDGTKIAFMSTVSPEFSELPFEESNKKNKEKSDSIENNPIKAKVFTKLFYRHWDHYVEDKRHHLFVVNRDGSGCRDATPGDRDSFPNSTTFSVGDDFTFTPDSKHLVFAAAPAKDESWSTNYDLCRVAIDNRSTQWESLTSDNLAADNGPRFSSDGKWLAYRSQNTPGYEAAKWELKMVAVSPDGALIGKPIRLTGDEHPSADDFKFGVTSLNFIADVNGYKRLYSVPTPDHPKDSLWRRSNTLNEGTILSYSAIGNQSVILLARMDQPAEVFVYGGEVGTEKEPYNLSKANETLLSHLDRPRPESVQVKVEDGEMQMWILKPPGFDPKQKWPVAYLVHGGPQSAWEDGWSYRWNPMLWAAQGYVVALPNPRGSTGFGQKFCDQISGDWGGKCYRDLVAGVEHVKRLPYVDTDRIASAGASFGGYMQNWFAVNEIAKEFKCLITHCSVYNFESMWGTTDELWFDEYEHGGLPWEVPGKYREFSPHIKAGNLGKYKTPMLIIHNDNDFRCPIGQGHELFNALQRQGVPSRFVNFPDENHWVQKLTNSKYWHQEVFQWLKKYAPPGGR